MFTVGTLTYMIIVENDLWAHFVVLISGISIATSTIMTTGAATGELTSDEGADVVAISIKWRSC